MGRAGDNTPSFLESDGTFITKPQEITILMNILLGKLRNLKKINSDTKISKQLINDYRVKNKDCAFEFQLVQVNEVEKLLNVHYVKPLGLDNLADGLWHYCLTHMP